MDSESNLLTAINFFHVLFEQGLRMKCGNIEIRAFRKGGPAQAFFFSSGKDAAQKALELCSKGADVYFGVNLRYGNAGKKENIKFLNSFHAELDYGSEGHKKPSKYQSYEECLEAIRQFEKEPTFIVHSGGGFHCYWVLSTPLPVQEYGVEILESINKSLTLALGGDPGTQDISRILRVPGTFNYKNPDHPRPVSLIKASEQKYDILDFTALVKNEIKGNYQSICLSTFEANWQEVDNLPVSERIKFLIKNGNDGAYLSRSEADMAVITALVNKGVSEDKIKEVFQKYPIGEKYRSHNAPEKYLFHSINKAKEMAHLTEEEMADPLFISGAIQKGDKGYSLNIVKFEEYMAKKHRLKVLDQERAIFKYNGKCYEQLSVESLNRLCQKELGKFRHLFKNAALTEFIHYVIGDALVESDKARNDQVNYLTLQNGLYDLKEGKLIDHNPNIFTTNLLPYDYDSNASCPKFIKFLQENFLHDQEKIDFIQEAVGYAFHQALPTPAIFFLLGEGSNGKSVFINTLTKLVGEKNTSNVSFNKLCEEYYILQLFHKMINISAETPQVKKANTDIIKAVVAGDWVTGREPYKQPMKFRPYAKHYLSMNTAPNITDTSHGMWRRIMVIEFPRTITEDEMDRELEEKLALELSGIFNWAIEGYRRLKARNFRFMEPKALTSSKEAYREKTDSVRMYAKNCLQKTGNEKDKIKFGEVYKQYISFCQEERKSPETKLNFKKRLQELGFKIDKSKKDSNQVCLFGANIKSIE